MFKKLWNQIKYWFWTKPVSRPDPPKASDVLKEYVVIDYKGQYINLRKTELIMFEKLSRKDKRAMSRKFETMERKGLLKFVEINGKMVAIKNKDYAEQAHIRELRTSQARQGQRSHQIKKRRRALCRYFI